jgi:DNA-binding response OmpR family regulator
MKVLLVDDDPDLLDVTAYALRREGINVIVATDGAQAIRQWVTEHPNLVILDIGLPRMDGIEVCRRIRRTSSTPVLILTGLNSDEQVVRGFSAGADDYVTKPFSPRQLAARIHAIVGRSGNSTPGGFLASPEPLRELRVGDLVVDADEHVAKRSGQIIQLTRTEFRLLHILALNVNRVVSASRLVEYGWGYGKDDISLLKTHISHIRGKLELSAHSPVQISAVARVGYRLSVVRNAASAAPEREAPELDLPELDAPNATDDWFDAERPLQRGQDPQLSSEQNGAEARALLRPSAA